MSGGEVLGVISKLSVTALHLPRTCMYPASHQPKPACACLASTCLSLYHPSLPHQSLFLPVDPFFFGALSALAWLLSQFLPLPAGLTRTFLALGLLALDKTSGRIHLAFPLRTSTRLEEHHQSTPLHTRLESANCIAPHTTLSFHRIPDTESSCYLSLDLSTLINSIDDLLAFVSLGPPPSGECVLQPLLSIGRHETAQSVNLLFSNLIVDSDLSWGGLCYFIFCLRDITNRRPPLSDTCSSNLAQRQRR